MASQVSGDLSLIESGPCSLRFGGDLLGHTMEGVRLNMPPDVRKRMTDEYGTNFAQAVFQGDNIEVSTTLAEKTLDVIAIVFGWGYEIDAMLWGWGRSPGLVSDDIADELIIHPLEMGADTSKDVKFWMMVPSNVQEIEFGQILSDRVFGVTWSAVIDETKRSGYLLGRMGLGGEVVPEIPDGVFAFSDGSLFQLSDGSYFVL